MDWKDIGRSIRRKRVEKSWRQEDLAERANLSSSYIGMIERGEKMPKLETFIVIANVLEVSADELLSGVINTGYKVRMSEYSDRIGNMSKEKQRMVYGIIDVILQNGK